MSRLPYNPAIVTDTVLQITHLDLQQRLDDITFSGNSVIGFLKILCFLILS